MTEIIAEDGSKIVTDLPAEKVADLQAKPAEPAAEPAKPDAQPASPKIEEQPAKAEANQPKPEPAKPAEPARDDKGQFRPKPKPIANLLSKQHELKTQLEERDKKIADLQTQLGNFSKQPASAATTDDIKAFAEEIGADPAVLQRLVDFARKGFQAPQLPKEVADLVAREQANKQEQAELQGFENDYSNLTKGIPDAEINDAKVKERLYELAYSEDKAPDGEEYYKKPLVELYFKYVKPELEPGSIPAEPSRGGSKTGGQVTDFAEIKADPSKLAEFAQSASTEEFAKFQKWERETSGDSPLMKRTF